jgi:hypothetical protein
VVLVGVGVSVLKGACTGVWAARGGRRANPYPAHTHTVPVTTHRRLPCGKLAGDAKAGGQLLHEPRVHYRLGDAARKLQRRRDAHEQFLHEKQTAREGGGCSAAHEVASARRLGAVSVRGMKVHGGVGAEKLVWGWGRVGEHGAVSVEKPSLHVCRGGGVRKHTLQCSGAHEGTIGQDRQKRVSWQALATARLTRRQR